MKRRRYSTFELRRRISKCKKRLHNLSIQGFTFSKNIYNDIDALEEKILKPTILNQIWKKKGSLAFGIIFILILSIAVILLWPQDTSPNISIDFTNAFDGIVIRKSCHINGTASIEEASSINIQKLNVQFKIDNQLKENKTIKLIKNETNLFFWSFYLNITGKENGKYNISVICFENKDLSNSANITIEIEKPTPKIGISSPKDNSIDLNGLINISGDAFAEFSEIQKVMIKFDNGEEKSSICNKKKTHWYYRWNSIDVDNGPHSISVRTYNGEIWSKNVSINFTVFNLCNWNISDLGDQLFQFVIRDIYHIMIPGNTYTMYGAHRSKNDPGNPFTNSPIHTYLEFPNKPDWLLLSLDNNYFVTPRDENIHYFTFNISITDNAKQGVYSEDFLGWKACYGTTEWAANICRNSAMDDIWIKTGQW